MQDQSKLYTPREDVERLLEQTLQGTDKPGKKQKGKLSPGKIVRRTLYGVLVLSLLLMLGKVWAARLTGSVPSLFGYQIYVVETGSMIPTLPIGSTILVRELSPDTALKAGDIITYAYERAVVTHRITDLVPQEDGRVLYQTKGDNPDNSPDPWLVAREDVRGVVVWHFSLPFGR